MNILALDLGTSSGFALMEDGRVESGTVIFDVKRGESPGCRYIRFNRWLEDVVLADGAPRIRLVVYEQTHFRGGAATEVASGFATRVQEFCARHGIDHFAVHSSTLKKFGTGSGRASKDEMLVAAQQQWPEQGVHGDDQADALMLLSFALTHLASGEEDAARIAAAPRTRPTPEHGGGASRPRSDDVGKGGDC